MNVLQNSATTRPRRPISASHYAAHLAGFRPDPEAYCAAIKRAIEGEQELPPGTIVRATDPIAMRRPCDGERC